MRICNYQMDWLERWYIEELTLYNFLPSGSVVMQFISITNFSLHLKVQMDMTNFQENQYPMRGIVGNTPYFFMPEKSGS